MPELPEVETVRRSLAPLVGRSVSCVALHRRDVVITPDDPFGGVSRARTGAPRRQRRVHDGELLAGARITDIRRHGKQLALVADNGGAIVVQLGMSGRMTLHGGDKPREPHTHIEWKLDSGLVLAFIDPRRFGGVRAIGHVDDLHQLWATTLGPDALTVRASALRENLAGTSRAIKSALLDQRVLAGVGNIYADEALFASQIHPARKASDLSSAEIRTLAEAIRGTLRQAVEHRGSTLRDYRDAFGTPGGYTSRHAVYGRSGQPCRSCRSTLCTSQIAQRATVWCPACQPNSSTEDSQRM